MDIDHIHLMQICFVSGISIARYIVYILIMEGTKAISPHVFEMISNNQSKDTQLVTKVNRNKVLLFVAASATVYLNGEIVFKEDFFLIFVAYLISKYPEAAKKSGATVTYGTGMACSFIEGYLVHIIPSDGAQFVGFLENIKIFESRQGIVFPVKRMFLIITKSMHCPPDLKEFNDESGREDIARLEACKLNQDETSDMFQSFEQVEKDVAGVKGRKYKNSAYKINRPNKKPVYIAAECATPLHTLYKVIKNRTLYEELADLNVEDVISDFTTMLQTCLTKSPELRNKCELVYFDDTNPKLNLADVLLERIKEIEPNFEVISGSEC